MRFRTLTLHHFGPYKGDHTLAFPTDPDRNVMVVFGDNMRGKTSIINAIRWALYGRALNRQRVPFSIETLINRDARSAHDWEMWVTLVFEADGKTFELHRSVARQPYVSAPKRDSDFTQTVLLRRDGVSLPASTVEREINHYIPEQIARFYLFDADVLQEYELLLSEQDEQARTIKEAIEKVLGVPALTNGRDDQRQLLKKSQTLLANEARQDKSTEEQARLSLQLQAEIETLNQDLRTLLEKSRALADDVSSIDIELRETESIQELMARAERLRIKAAALEQEESEVRRERLDILRDAWQDLLLTRVEEVRQDLVQRIDVHQVAIERAGVLKSQLAALDPNSIGGSCSACGQALPVAARESSLARRQSITEELALLAPRMSELATLSERLSALSRVRGSNALHALRRIEETAGRTAVELTRVESDLETVEAALRGHPLDRIAQLQKRRDTLHMQRGSLEKAVESTRGDIALRERKHESVSKLLAKQSSAALGRFGREVSVIGALAAIFAESVDRLRDSLRLKVASEASSVFLQLTTEHTYRELQINDNYGLTIIDALGRPVNVRSAGAEQIVALSLLAALNRTAHRAAPVVIDTPFARLDPLHRTNIMTFVPSMAEQVVFLVHEGELPKDKLGPIASRIGAIYQIERETSSHSRLIPIQETA